MKSTARFGYDYPDFEGLHGASPDEIKRRIEMRVIELYAPKSFFRGEPGDYKVEWIVRIRVPHYLVKKSFKVLVFLGEVDSSPEKWVFCPAYVGCIGVFVNR
jgi:hypothetical protein